ncbi:MAG: hypothetical protein HW388_371 [Dehalococcoidia bacterium]|nr:hypothetical protein [Dehalococcoidia bacterium]
MEFSSLIDQLEAVISSGTGVPATRRVLLERDKLTDLVAQMREAMPSDIQEAQELLQMRENLINQALMEARRIKTIAEGEAKARVNESEITKAALKSSDEMVAEAQRRAQRILDEANAQANARRAGANEYAQATMQQLEGELLEVLSTVRRGLDVLDGGKKPSA